MKTNIEKIFERIEALESNILSGSNLTTFQRASQCSIQTFVDEIKVICERVRLSEQKAPDHNQRFPGNLLVMDNPNIRFTEGLNPEIAIHGVQDVVLSQPYINKDEIYGTQVWRNLYILHEVKKDGRTEIRKINLNLFSDDRDKVKMGRGNITHSIHKQTKLQSKADREAL